MTTIKECPSGLRPRPSEIEDQQKPSNTRDQSVMNRWEQSWYRRARSMGMSVCRNEQGNIALFTPPAGFSLPQPRSTATGTGSAPSSASPFPFPMGMGSAQPTGRAGSKEAGKKDEEKKPDGMSAGDIGGIVGGSLGGIALAVLAFFGIRRVVRARSDRAEATATPPPSSGFEVEEIKEPGLLSRIISAFSRSGSHSAQYEAAEALQRIVEVDQQVRAQILPETYRNMTAEQRVELASAIAFDQALPSGFQLNGDVVREGSVRRVSVISMNAPIVVNDGVAPAERDVQKLCKDYESLLAQLSGMDLPAEDAEKWARQIILERAMTPAGQWKDRMADYQKPRRGELLPRAYLRERGVVGPRAETPPQDPLHAVGQRLLEGLFRSPSVAPAAPLMPAPIDANPALQMQRLLDAHKLLEKSPIYQNLSPEKKVKVLRAVLFDDPMPTGLNLPERRVVTEAGRTGVRWGNYFVPQREPKPRAVRNLQKDYDKVVQQLLNLGRNGAGRLSQEDARSWAQQLLLERRVATRAQWKDAAGDYRARRGQIVPNGWLAERVGSAEEAPRSVPPKTQHQPPAEGMVPRAPSLPPGLMTTMTPLAIDVPEPTEQIRKQGEQLARILDIRDQILDTVVRDGELPERDALTFAERILNLDAYRDFRVNAAVNAEGNPIAEIKTVDGKVYEIEVNRQIMSTIITGRYNAVMMELNAMSSFEEFPLHETDRWARRLVMDFEVLPAKEKMDLIMRRGTPGQNMLPMEWIKQRIGNQWVLPADQDPLFSVAKTRFHVPAPVPPPPAGGRGAAAAPAAPKANGMAGVAEQRPSPRPAAAAPAPHPVTPPPPAAPPVAGRTRQSPPPLPQQRPGAEKPAVSPAPKPATPPPPPPAAPAPAEHMGAANAAKPADRAAARRRRSEFEKALTNYLEQHVVDFKDMGVHDKLPIFEAFLQEAGAMLQGKIAVDGRIADRALEEETYRKLESVRERLRADQSGRERVRAMEIRVLRSAEEARPVRGK